MVALLVIVHRQEVIDRMRMGNRDAIRNPRVIGSVSVSLRGRLRCQRMESTSRGIRDESKDNRMALEGTWESVQEALRNLYKSHHKLKSIITRGRFLGEFGLSSLAIAPLPSS